MFREKERRSAFIRIDRFTEVVALCFCAIVRLKKFQLLQCLYPFCYHLQVQSVSHADDGADDSAAIRAVRKIVNEMHLVLFSAKDFTVHQYRPVQPFGNGHNGVALRPANVTRFSIPAWNVANPGTSDRLACWR